MSARRGVSIGAVLPRQRVKALATCSLLGSRGRSEGRERRCGPRATSCGRVHGGARRTCGGMRGGQAEPSSLIGWTTGAAHEDNRHKPRLEERTRAAMKAAVNAHRGEGERGMRDEGRSIGLIRAGTRGACYRRGARWAADSSRRFIGLAHLTRDRAWAAFSGVE